ncbi:hypothetical protein ACKVMT_10070 [Halobacteriales archaeon Cl-PHB]
MSLAGSLAAAFPYHTVPDGNAWLPHHATWALLFALVPLAVVWDDHPDREPVVALTAVLAALFAFLFVWPRYAVLGAALTVAAVSTAGLSLSARLAWYREEYPWPFVLLALALVVVAADDVLQHAFGWPMPLDWVWKNGLRSTLTGF